MSTGRYCIEYQDKKQSRYYFQYFVLIITATSSCFYLFHHTPIGIFKCIESKMHSFLFMGRSCLRLIPRNASIV